jgi:membrane-associated phospholipid phosphatase
VAVAILGACVLIVVVLGVLFAHQRTADGFDKALDSPVISFFAGHGQLLPRMAYPGTLIPAVLVSVVIAACCLAAGRLNGAVLALTAVPVATGLDDGLLKHVFDRTYYGALVFPSGHTTTVVALAATLAVLLLVPPQRAGTLAPRVLAVAVSCAAACVVATAVIALRWHYFTDTVAGAAVGVGTVCVLSLILDLVWQARSR